MNQDQNETINDLNAYIFEYNKAVVIFMSFFMFVGIVGNSLTLYIYLFRMKSSTLQIFIVHLGFVDMLGCCLSVPLEMVDLILPYMYPSDFICKLQVLILYYTCTASSFSLLVIAVERFNRVCRPLARQISTFYSKWIVVGVSLVSLFISIPTCLDFHRGEIQFENGIVGYGCNADISLFWEVNYYILTSLYLLCLLIMFILYFFIWRKARQHFRQLDARRHKKPKDDSDKLTHLNQETTHISSQVNLTIFSITTLFVVSFAPNFILNFAHPVYTPNTYIVIKIFHRLWVLNCSLNPVVYGIFNQEFRQECKRLFSKEMNHKSSDNKMEEYQLALRHPLQTEHILL